MGALPHDFGRFDDLAQSPALGRANHLGKVHERRDLREIIETAEVVREGDHIYLLARVSAATLDSLATFETSREDLEEEPDVEQVNEDGSDNEDGTNESSHDGDAMGPDHRRYLAGRQERHRATYDRTGDEAELRKVARQVNALAVKKRKRVEA